MGDDLVSNKNLRNYEESWLSVVIGSAPSTVNWKSWIKQCTNICDAINSKYSKYLEISKTLRDQYFSASNLTWGFYCSGSSLLQWRVDLLAAQLLLFSVEKVKQIYFHALSSNNAFGGKSFSLSNRLPSGLEFLKKTKLNLFIYWN